MKRLLVLLLFIVIPVFGMAATIHVPGDQPTIQQGIAAAVDGDTVLVAPGTYVENIDFLGKAITVISEQGPEVTIIDGGSPTNPDFGSVVTFDSGEGPDSNLEGFTLTNGTGTLFEPSGGNPGYEGGGIFTHYSSPAITGNIITGNTCPGIHSLGGGIFAHNASPTITGNTISGNSAEGGGGIELSMNCFSNIADNTITGNTGRVYGGGISVLIDSDPVISNNLIYENVSEGLIGFGGGGIQVAFQCSPTITGNTISGNSAADVGGGIDIQIDCHPVIMNTIFWGNIAPTGSEGYVGFADSLAISYSDVDGGQTAVYVESGGTLTWGGGMIDEDPLFCTGPYGDYPDYYLSQDPCQPGVDNPCVDEGHPFSPMIEETTRTDGHPDSGTVDMGYHYPLLDTVTADLSCVPDSGVLPIATQFSVTLGNVVDSHRTVAGRINLTLASGATYQSWRAGYTNLGPTETFVTAWQQTLPALGSLVGENVFELDAEDVTPPPYNQPPYPPAGDTATASCIVTGITP